MAHESFENPRSPPLMNELFVNIKVDREERPDLDPIYMTRVQAMTGHGGWPMTVFLTPDGTPFYGGTYFPPSDARGCRASPSAGGGRQRLPRAPGRRRRERRRRSRELLRELSADADRRADARRRPCSTRRRVQLARTFDARQRRLRRRAEIPAADGARVPAAPAQAHRRRSARSSWPSSRSTRWPRGGIYDQVGGGFHRYSVDASWLVPHFEKMLYDNALLASLYLAAFQFFGNRATAASPRTRSISSLREMTGPEGGFYSTLDADTEGHEGVLHLDAGRAGRGPRRRRRGGGARLVRGGAGRQFRGAVGPVDAARDGGRGGPARHRRGRAGGSYRAYPGGLLAAREQRMRPGRDEKAIAAWNGLMLTAFADGSRILGRDDFREIAVRNATSSSIIFSGTAACCGVGKMAMPARGVLEDYAFVIDGLLALYRTTLEVRWLSEAMRLADVMVEEFADREGVGFFDTSAGTRPWWRDRAICTTGRRPPAMRWRPTPCYDWAR